MLVLLMILPTITSCRRDRDPVSENLKLMIKNCSKHLPKSSGEMQRAQLALLKWENRVLDRKPLLMTALLTKAIGAENVSIGLITFNEDKDIIGLGIMEKCVDANGLKTFLIEEYDAFVHWVIRPVLEIHMLPIQIRNAHQRKDNQRWDKYVRGEGIDVNDIRNVERWKETLPPVWITLPDPNSTDVYIYIYDNAGNKSDPIQLHIGPTWHYTEEGVSGSTLNGLLPKSCLQDRCHMVEYRS